MHLIFERTSSALYYSNDGRLRTGQHTADDEGVIYTLEFDGEEVFATRDRLKVDAYIAGYDQAIAFGQSDAAKA